MIIDFYTKKIIRDTGKCKTCKWNVGYNAKHITVWCDKKSEEEPLFSTCKDYIFDASGGKIN